MKDTKLATIIYYILRSHIPYTHKHTNMYKQTNAQIGRSMAAKTRRHCRSIELAKFSFLQLEFIMTMKMVVATKQCAFVCVFDEFGV